jgi:hypothetical protein
MTRFNRDVSEADHDVSDADRMVLKSLARAVLDLCDGLGGDAQEQDRARDIAFRLEELAGGWTTTPIEPHEAARARRVPDTTAPGNQCHLCGISSTGGFVLCGCSEPATIHVFCDSDCLSRWLTATSLLAEQDRARDTRDLAAATRRNSTRGGVQ